MAINTNSIKTDVTCKRKYNKGVDSFPLHIFKTIETKAIHI